jgi:AhpD family alkylhydroperoxidase
MRKGMGFVPNLMATMTNSTVLITSYRAMSAAFDKGSFKPIERQVIELTASRENECHYCVAAHATILKSMLKADPAMVDAVKKGLDPEDPKLAALAQLTAEIVAKRGRPSEAAIEKFFAVGYRKDQLLELLIGVGLKTITNYMDHMNPVDIDPAFAAEA